MTPEDAIKEAKAMMNKAIEHHNHELAGLHTGKASSSMVEGIIVEVAAYGSTMALRDIAAVTTPDARSIRIEPWDKNVLKDIEKAILKENIGLTPSIQGSLVRINVPELSGERRKELAKVAHKIAEDGRVSIRHARHHALDPIKKMQKDGEISEDDLHLYEKDIQKLHDDYIEKINVATEAKEKELTEV